MAKLFIIGNGFDIWNGLPTSYRHFKASYHKQLEGYTNYFDDLTGIDSDWANFEESLSSFNEDAFHDYAALQPTLEELSERPALLYGFEDEISNKREELVAEIKSAFNSWIRSIDVTCARKLIRFASPAYFVSFNYTRTLQDVYGVPNSCILHIHGNV